MKRSFLLISTIFCGVNIALVQTVAQAKTKIEISRIAQGVTLRIESVNSDNKGSGVLLAQNGDVYTVLTAAHVVNKGSAFKIRTPDGVVHQSIKSVIANKNLDLAVVKFSSKNSYKLVTIGSSKSLERGSEVFVAGFPTSTLTVVDESLQSTAGNLTSSIVSPDANGYSLIYDAVTQPGMSGGPVLNNEGQLIGIHGKGARDTSGSQKNGFNLGIVIENVWALSAYFDIAGSLYLTIGNRTNQGDYIGALRDCNQLIYYNSDFSDAYVLRGIIQSNLKDFSAALSDYNKAIELDSASAFAYAYRGFLKALNTNDSSGGLSDLNKAVQINPKYDFAYSIRGWVKEHKFNDFPGALSDYDKTILLDPNNPGYYFQRGLLKKNKLKDSAGSIQDFRQALRLYAKNDKLKDVQKVLDELRELGVTE